jgi:pilus assembly protein CpaB
MRAKSLVLLILALGCGLVASIGINQYLAARSSTPAESPEGTVLVLVASQEIPKSMTVTDSMIRLEHWPEGSAPGGAINDPARAVGRAAKQTVFPGEPLLELKLAEPGAERAESTIPKNLRAFTVRVDTQSGVAGFVKPGARVDVLLSVSKSNDIRTAMSKTILTNVEVWAVDQAIRDEEDDPQATLAKAVTLLVKPEDVERLSLATTQGKVSLSLRNPVDTTEEATARGVSIHQLLGQAASSGADMNPQVKSSDFGSFLNNLTPETSDPKPEVKPAGPTHTMVIIRGDEVEQKTFSLN